MVKIWRILKIQKNYGSLMVNKVYGSTARDF